LSSPKIPRGGFVVWLTGLPGAGKTTISGILAGRLREIGLRVEQLDGDEIRRWLSPNEGFSREDRERHLRRVAHVANLLSRNDVVVLCSFVSPYSSSRKYARSVIQNFFEVHVKCSLETCIRRDPKGLYRQAADGKITNMTGLQDSYEPPESPELVVDTEEKTPQESADAVLVALQQFGYLRLN
jgi:adenylylsulfate kinase